MTLDEAIENKRVVAEFFKKIDDVYLSQEAEQLAEWLEELKVLRLQNHLLRDEALIAGRKEGYSKAIDDFANFDYCIICAKKGNDTDCYYCRVNMAQEEIAERLKAGGVDAGSV